MKTIATKALVLSLFLPIMSLAAESESQEQEIEEVALMRRLRSMSTYERFGFVKSIDDINKEYGEGKNTMLHIAATAGLPDFVKLLIEEKADPDRKNGSGLTSLELAAWTLWDRHREKEFLPRFS